MRTTAHLVAALALLSRGGARAQTGPASADEALDVMAGQAVAARRSETAATPSDAAAKTAPAPQPEAAPELPPATFAAPFPVVPAKSPLELHPGAIFWFKDAFRQPDVALYGSTTRADFSLYYARLTIDWKPNEWLGFHAEPRFRDHPLRSDMSSNFYVQEIYGFWKGAREWNVQLKAGKVSDKFGRASDGGFYQTPAYFDGMKLRADNGLSVEGGLPGPKGDFGLSYTLSYFFEDGEVSPGYDKSGGEFGGPRDTNFYPESPNPADNRAAPGARQRNAILVRLEPTFPLGDWVNIALGGSYWGFDADFPNLKFATVPGVCTGEAAGYCGAFGRVHVTRWEVDGTVSVGPLQFYGEYIRQFGKSVLAYPLAVGPNPADPTSGASSNNNYLLLMGQFKFGQLTLRYNWSRVGYQDFSISEVVSKPGIQWNFTPQMWLLAEWAYWTRWNHPADMAINAATGVPFASLGNRTGAVIDNSLNITLYTWF